VARHGCALQRGVYGGCMLSVAAAAVVVWRRVWLKVKLEGTKLCYGQRPHEEGAMINTAQEATRAGFYM
jgi:hypothetical protein